MVEFLLEPSGGLYKGWYINVAVIDGESKRKTLLVGIVGDMAKDDDRGLYLYPASIFSSDRVKILGVDII